MSEALAQEASPLGIHVTIVEPGPYGTDWSGSSAVHTEPIAAYEPVRAARRAGATARAPRDPQATADVILELVDTDEPPLRLFLGTYPYSRRRSRLPEAPRHLVHVVVTRRQGVKAVGGTPRTKATGGGRTP